MFVNVKTKWKPGPGPGGEKTPTIPLHSYHILISKAPVTFNLIQY